MKKSNQLGRTNKHGVKAPTKTMPTEISGKLCLSVRILGILFVVSAIYQLLTLAAHPSWYNYVFGYLPPDIVSLRYVVSWLWGFLSIGAGIGLFLRKRWARVTIIVMSIITIISVYWKYPYNALLRHTQSLDIQYSKIFAGHEDLGLSFSKFAGLVVFLQITVDVLFCSVVIYLLTRPAVRSQFNK